MSLQLATLRFTCSGVVTQARDLADKRLSTQSGKIAMSITFATLLSQRGVPNGNDLTESSASGQWRQKFTNNPTIDFDSLKSTGWDGCSGGCDSGDCTNNFCSLTRGRRLRDVAISTSQTPHTRGCF